MDFAAAVEAVQNGDLPSSKITQQLSTEKDEDGITLLHWAAFNNRCRIARALIDNGADINCKGGKVEETPLLWAMRRKFYAMCALLVEYGADIHALSISGDDLVHNCVKTTTDTEGDVQGLFLALQWGVGTDHRDNAGETALSWLAKNRVGDQAHDLMRLIMRYHDDDLECSSYKKQQGSREDKNSLLHLLAEKSGTLIGYKAKYSDLNIAFDIHQHPDIASWHSAKDSSAKTNKDGATPYELAGVGGMHTYMNYFLIDAMQYNVLPRCTPGVMATLVVIFSAVILGRYWWLWGSLWWGLTVPFMYKFSLQWNIPKQNAKACGGLVVGVAILMVVMMHNYEPSVASSFFWFFLSLTGVLSVRLSNTPPVTLPSGVREELAKAIIEGSPAEGPYMTDENQANKDKAGEGGPEKGDTIVPVVYTGPLICASCLCDKRLATNHCNFCNRCVCGQDAHIPHLGICAGQGNRRLFCFMLFAMAMTCVLFVLIAFSHHSIEICPQVGWWFIFHYMAVELCVAYEAPVQFSTWFIAFMGMTYTLTMLYTDLLFIGKELTLNLAANRLVTSLPNMSPDIFSRNLRTFLRNGSYNISFGDSRVEYPVPVLRRKKAREIDLPPWFRSLVGYFGLQASSAIFRICLAILTFFGECSGSVMDAPIFNVDSEPSECDDGDFDVGRPTDVDEEEKHLLTHSGSTRSSSSSSDSSSGNGIDTKKVYKEIQLHTEIYAKLEQMSKNREAFRKAQEEAKRRNQHRHSGHSEPCCERHAGTEQLSGMEVAAKSTVISADER